MLRNSDDYSRFMQFNLSFKTLSFILIYSQIRQENVSHNCVVISGTIKLNAEINYIAEIEIGITSDFI